MVEVIRQILLIVGRISIALLGILGLWWLSADYPPSLLGPIFASSIGVAVVCYWTRGKIGRAAVRRAEAAEDNRLASLNRAERALEETSANAFTKDPGLSTFYWTFLQLDAFQRHAGSVPAECERVLEAELQHLTHATSVYWDLLDAVPLEKSAGGSEWRSPSQAKLELTLVDLGASAARAVALMNALVIDQSRKMRRDYQAGLASKQATALELKTRAAANATRVDSQTQHLLSVYEFAYKALESESSHQGLPLETQADQMRCQASGAPNLLGPKICAWITNLDALEKTPNHVLAESVRRALSTCHNLSVALVRLAASQERVVKEIQAELDSHLWEGVHS